MIAVRHADRRGFTFIELLTVWAIITVLAAILFPVFTRAREKAWQTTCGSNLMNIGAALKMYGYEHYGHLPPANNDLRPLLPRYLYDAEVLLCPSTRREEGRLSIPAGNPDIACDYVYRGGLADDDYPTQVIAGDRIATIHNDGANYLFLDGHEKWMSAGSSVPPGMLKSLRDLNELRPEGDRAQLPEPGSGEDGGDE